MIKTIIDNGQPWTVKVENDKIKFYYGKTVYDQFVDSYYIETILKGKGHGLILDLGIPELSISFEGMKEIREWL